MAAVRTDLGTVIDRVDGIWNTVSDGVLEVNYAVRQGTAVIYRSLEGLQGDVATLQSSIVSAREENSERFKEVSSRLQHLEEYVKSRDQQQDRTSLETSLKKARMHLKEYTGTGGDDFGLLDDAKRSCMDILALQPHTDTLNAHFMAGSIAVAASFTKHAQGCMPCACPGRSANVQHSPLEPSSATPPYVKLQQQPPATAKRFVFDGVFQNVVFSFESFWANPSMAPSPEWNSVVEYLLNVTSSVCMLPPEGLILPQLDVRLVKAFGVLCSSEPAMLDRFPEVGGAALRALLQPKPLDDLCRMSKEMGVDVALCDNKADLIQGMIDTRQTIAEFMDPVARIDERETTGGGGSSNSNDVDWDNLTIDSY